MKIIKDYATTSGCYKAGRTITVKCLMLHSVGCNQPDPKVFARFWKNSDDVCCHGVLGADGTVIQTLPWNHRGWHCGGSANGTHIGVEMTEPSTIRYTGGANFVDNNPADTKKFVLGTYKTAVELFAYLCKMYGLNPLGDGVIVSHSEGYKRGIASGHADVEHIWNKYGLSMNQFRKDVKAAMNGSTVNESNTVVLQNHFTECVNHGRILSPRSVLTALLLTLLMLVRTAFACLMRVVKLYIPNLRTILRVHTRCV